MKRASAGTLPPSRVALWRRRSLDVLTSEVVAGRARGPEPPRAWAGRLRQLVDASRRAESRTSLVVADQRLLRQRRDPHRFGQLSLGRDEAARAAGSSARDLPVHAGGLGALRGSTASRRKQLPPGAAFFAVIPSRHHYYLPEASPGWTFGWIGVYHPYLIARIARQVAATGAVLQLQPQSALAAIATRLVRGRVPQGLPRSVRGRAGAVRIHRDLRAAWRSSCAIPTASASGCSTSCAAASWPTRASRSPSTRSPPNAG